MKIKGNLDTHVSLLFSGESDGFQVEVAMQYNDGLLRWISCPSLIMSALQDGGTHETGLKTA